MAFINKVKEIIKLFEESTREEIGISLLAYEEFICKGLKISDSKLKKLSDIFNYYDEHYSDEYPSLTNESLQNINDLICGYYSNFEKDGYNFKITYEDRTSDGTLLNVSVRENHSLILVDELQYTVTDKRINCEYDKDPFNTMIRACQEVQKEIKKTNIEDILKSYKL